MGFFDDTKLVKRVKASKAELVIPETLEGKAQLADADAMLALAEGFRKDLSEKYLKIEADWEEDPAGKKKAYNLYAKSHKDEVRNAKAGIMWYLRAAMCQNEKAAAVLADHPYWGELSLIPEMFFYEGRNLTIRIKGTDLKQAGFLDFKDKGEYQLESMNSKGIFNAKVETADGMANYYCFDEYFNLLGESRNRTEETFASHEPRFNQEVGEKKKEFEVLVDAYRMRNK